MGLVEFHVGSMIGLRDLNLSKNNIVNTLGCGLEVRRRRALARRSSSRVAALAQTSSHRFELQQDHVAKDGCNASDVLLPPLTTRRRSCARLRSAPACSLCR